jgi:pyrimidine oxygenase
MSSALIASEIKTHQAIDPDNLSYIIGSPRTVANRLSEIAAVGGLEAALFDFDDFREGLDRFGAEVLPLLDFDYTKGAPQ